MSCRVTAPKLTREHLSHRKASIESTSCSKYRSHSRTSSIPILLLLLFITSVFPFLVSANSPNANPFVVVLKRIREKSTSSIDDHLAWIQAIDKNTTNPSTLASNGAIGNFQWYSGNFDRNTLNQINSSDVVEYVVEDVTFHIQEQVQINPPSWGLDRIDERVGVDGFYHFPTSAGEGVNIYVIDTGVNIYHDDLIGRASAGPSFNGNENSGSDPNGHGTFVAGICCGTTYGVAKKSNVIAVKALNADGSGQLSNVLLAIDWVVQQHTSGASNKTIVNLSLGANYSETTNQAIDQAIAQGIHFTIAAGNDANDACNYSPASAFGGLTVGATNLNDSIASYSNTGLCVDIYAPGTEITSISNSSNTSTSSRSGTSMASPHVAGIMALILAEGNYTPPELVEKILSDASTNSAGSKTAFAYVNAFDNKVVVTFKGSSVLSSYASKRVPQRGKLSWLGVAMLIIGLLLYV